MKSFDFKGEIPASKSILNRALLMQSYFPSLKILGDSNCNDVVAMKNAIAEFRNRQIIRCSEAGTVLRFMAFRASREVGSFELNGSLRLMSRPHEEMIPILKELGVQCRVSSTEIKIQSEGWKKPASILQIHPETSSQFASGLLLNAWNLPFDLEMDVQTGLSEGYLLMSLNLARQLGMTIEQNGRRWNVPAFQTMKSEVLRPEPDYSSVFAVAAAATLAGQAVVENFTSESLQPDFHFVELLKKMQVTVEIKGQSATFHQGSGLKAVDVNLRSCPDLFPVLSVLCSFAQGTSRLTGAPHLKFKESDRIQKTAELLTSAGIQNEAQEDGLIIHGKSEHSLKSFVFDPDADHRMAMAAGLLKLKGFDIQIRHPEVVNKSYPEFWKVLGVLP